MINQEDLEELCNAALLANFNVNNETLKLTTWQAGEHTHKPVSLPNGHAAVYIFERNNIFLKVGKVNLNSNDRYRYQHYNPKSSNSNLASSLLKDTNPIIDNVTNQANIKSWNKNNTTRYNILIPATLGANFVNFVEAFFILNVIQDMREETKTKVMLTYLKQNIKNKWL